MILLVKILQAFLHPNNSGEDVSFDRKKRYIRGDTVLRWTRPGDHATPATTTPNNWNADPVNTPVETVPTLPCICISTRKATDNIVPFRFSPFEGIETKIFPFLINECTTFIFRFRIYIFPPNIWNISTCCVLFNIILQQVWLWTFLETLQSSKTKINS